MSNVIQRVEYQNRKTLFILILILILVGVGVRLWAAVQWQTNFDSDEAIFGLMAKHIAEGNYTATVYGTEHLGSLESILAAPFMRLDPSSVVLLRLPAVALFLIFLISHVVLVSKLFNKFVAGISLLPLSFPAFQMLSWTFQPIGAYIVLLLIGTLIVFISSPLIFGYKLPALRLLILGVLVGLGYWSNQMILAYVVPVVVVGFLRSDWWMDLRHQIESVVRPIPILNGQSMGLLLVLGLILLGTLAFFVSGCDPVWRFSKVEKISRWMISALGFFGVVGAIFLAKHKRQKVMRFAYFIVGVVAGYAPQWIPWIIQSERPGEVLWRSCPTGIPGRAELLISTMLPAIWGLPGLDRLVSFDLPLAIFWSAISAIFLIALIGCFWIYRRAFGASLFIEPLDSEQAIVVLVGILFLLPIFLSLMASNTIDVYSSRHLLVSWQAGSILLGLFIAENLRNKRIILSGLALAAIVLVSANNLSNVEGLWRVKFTRYQRSDIEQLALFMEKMNGDAAYSDYWGAYTLTFLMGEENIVAPYNGLDRIPSYSRTAHQQEKQIFIMPGYLSPNRDSGIEGLLSTLQSDNFVSGEGPARSSIIDQAQNLKVKKIESIPPWVIWVLE